MFGFTTQYMTRNGEPWFPVMGEIHYSRVPRQYWRETLYKMKAGGVNVVSSYVIWIHHEEAAGEVDFSGNKDLRAFLQACKDCGLYMVLRIGPWCHGEVRNGGFPDWMLKYDIRTNDAQYLEQAKRFYGLIYEQAKDFLLKAGGPVIGVQIENEYGHCGGLTGDEGEAHMRALAAMAKEIGFDVPLYTATGWGGAVTGGLLPVMGGYCDAPWDQRVTELEPSGNYIFTYERNDHNIGSDHRLGEGITFDVTKFPYLTAELGGGLQVTQHRRPVCTGKDVGAMSLVKLGSGVNLLGYYMYCGGTNPKGKYSTLQESKATGYLNDLPELSYDFRTAIREYGQLSDTFYEIKLLAMFLHQWGPELTQMPAYIPEENPLDPANLTDLRWSLRHNGEWGFVFVNNYVRRRTMPNHKNVKLPVQIGDAPVEVTPINVRDGEYFFYPVNMPVHGGVIKWATATPLCMDGTTTVFYGDKDAVFITEGAPDYRLISREDAKHAYLCGETFVVSEFPVIENGAGGWTVLKQEPVDGGCALRQTAAGKYTVALTYPADRADYFLHIRYRGERARAYLNGELIADDFYAGEDWTIGLKRFDFPSELKLEVAPLHDGDHIYLERWPEMENGSICCVDAVTLTCETTGGLF